MALIILARWRSNSAAVLAPRSLAVPLFHGPAVGDTPLLKKFSLQVKVV